jgi:hypothetical protein
MEVHRIYVDEHSCLLAFEWQIVCAASGVVEQNDGPAHAYTAFLIARAISSDTCKDVGKGDHSIVLN